MLQRDSARVTRAVASSPHDSTVLLRHPFSCPSVPSPVMPRRPEFAPSQDRGKAPDISSWCAPRSVRISSKSAPLLSFALASRHLLSSCFTTQCPYFSSRHARDHACRGCRSGAHQYALRCPCPLAPFSPSNLCSQSPPSLPLKGRTRTRSFAASRIRSTRTTLSKDSLGSFCSLGRASWASRSTSLAPNRVSKAGKMALKCVSPSNSVGAPQLTM